MVLDYLIKLLENAERTFNIKVSGKLDLHGYYVFIVHGNNDSAFMGILLYKNGSFTFHHCDGGCGSFAHPMSEIADYLNKFRVI